MSVRYELRVVPDPDPILPSDWGNEDAFLVSDHRDFYVKPPEHLALEDEDFDIFPLVVYSHSGVALSLDNRGWPFNCRWDSAVAGRVYVRKNVDWQGTPQEVAQGVVDEWNQVLCGDVWGYEVVKIETCSLGHEHEVDVVSSCWGFSSEEDARSEGEASLAYETAA